MPKYTALILCTQEVLWVCTILKDLGREQVGATQIGEDNQAVIDWPATQAITPKPSTSTSVTTSFERAKLYHRYLSTVNQLADMPSKAMGIKRLKYLLHASGIGLDAYSITLMRRHRILHTRLSNSKAYR